MQCKGNPLWAWERGYGYAGTRDEREILRQVEDTQRLKFSKQQKSTNLVQEIGGSKLTLE